MLAQEGLYMATFAHTQKSLKDVRSKEGENFNAAEFNQQFVDKHRGGRKGAVVSVRHDCIRESVEFEPHLFTLWRRAQTETSGISRIRRHFRSPSTTRSVTQRERFPLPNLKSNFQKRSDRSGRTSGFPDEADLESALLFLMFDN